ncbi:MAG TPA: DUF3857 domain-containing protein [Terriglobales bacterium]|nr:DUF3857 domain-containing protein [Terriglobales bacterium]
MRFELKAPGAPAIILYRQVSQDNAGAQGYEDNYFRIKIFTEEGRRYADTIIPFVKSLQTVEYLKARTIKPDGSVVSFNGEAFEKEIVKSRRETVLAKVFTFPDVQVGSILEYSFTYKFKRGYATAPQWIVSQDLFTKIARFTLMPGRLDRSIGLRWVYHNLPALSGQPQQTADGRLAMVVFDVPALRTEDDMPPRNEVEARVDFIYSDGTVDTNPERFWKTVAKKRTAELEKFIDKQRAMQSALLQIGVAGASPADKLRRIYATIQQMKNTSYEVRRTEKEQKREQDKIASNAEQVWQRARGSGSELTWLFLGLARAAGFDASGVLVADRSDSFFDSTLLDDSGLSNSVVLVRIGGQEIYCDPGAAFTPFGLLPWPETGVPGLVLDGEGPTWVKTPLPRSADSRIERNGKFKLADNGDLEGKLTLTFTGLESVQWKIDLRDEDDAKRRESLEKEVKNYVPAAVEVDLLSRPDWTSATDSLVAELSLRIPGWVARAGRHALLPIGLFSAPEKGLFGSGERLYPVYMRFPYEVVDDFLIELPDGWEVSNLTKERNEDVHSVAYAIQVARENRNLHVVRKLKVDFLMLKTEYYQALRGFFQMVRTRDEEQIVLQPGNTEANN